MNSELIYRLSKRVFKKTMASFVVKQLREVFFKERVRRTETRQNSSQKTRSVRVFVIDGNFNIRSSSSIISSLNQMSEKYDWLYIWFRIMKSSSRERSMFFSSSEKLFSRIRKIRMFDLINVFKNEQISIQEMSRSMYAIAFSTVARLRRNIK